MGHCPFFARGVKTTWFVVSDVELLPLGCSMLWTTNYTVKTPNRTFREKGHCPLFAHGVKTTRFVVDDV